MSNVWFTSDLHIGHRRVAEHRFPVDLHARIPWQDEEMVKIKVKHHDQTLAENWDERVQLGDHVWVLGDLSAGGKAATLNAIEWIRARPGIKHLVPGNHCPVHPMYRDSWKWQSWYFGIFESIQMAARRRIMGREVLLSHFPYRVDHTEVARFNQWRLRDEGLILMHGHTHSAERLAGREIHVGVDAWGLRPVSLAEVTALMEEIP